MEDKPKIAVILSTPHELTSRIASVLHDAGMLSDYLVPFNARQVRIPSLLASRLNLGQWHYPIPATSGAPLHELATAATFRVMQGRRWARGTSRVARWRGRALDRAATRLLRKSRPQGVLVLDGRESRTGPTAESLGIPILHFLNGDPWGKYERLTQIAADSIDAAERDEALAEIAPGEVEQGTKRIQRAAIVIVESIRMARQAQFAGGDDKPVMVVGQGVDADFFVPGSVRAEAGPLKVCQVSRVGFGKGVHVTNAAVGLARAAVDSCTLAGWDGDTSPGLVERSHAITFEGGLPRAGVRALLQRSDVFVLPTFADPMPRAVLEAMACGLPVITTPDSGYEDLIADGVNGFIVPVGDPAAVAAVLVRLAEDSDLRGSVGRAARATAEENSWDAFAERFRGLLYSELLPMLARLRD